MHITPTAEQTTTTEHRSDRLHAAIEATQQLPPEYRSGLSSHLPMALHALHAMGADGPTMARFSASYAARFGDARRSSPRAAQADWRVLLAQPDGYEPLVASFTHQLAVAGRDATLRQALPVLWPGLAAAAFHGLIRTGHAVQGAHDGELAQALAYWAWRWQSMRPVEAPAAELPSSAWLQQLLAQGANWKSDLPLISRRMAQVQHTAGYAALADTLQWPAGGLLQALRPLAEFAAQRYALTRHFTVLHMVTACRAVATLAPWLADSPQCRAELLRAYVAAYLSCGLASDDRAESAPEGRALPAWTTITAAALRSGDDHVIKLVHACCDLQRLYGEEGPWQAAAAQAVSRTTA